MLKSLYIVVRFLIVICAVAHFLCSCSCNYHLDKAKAKCGYTIERDTVTVKDTVTVPGSQMDTVFKFVPGASHDTVIIREGAQTYKFFYNNRDSTVFLDGAVKTVTVPVEVKVPVEKTVIKESLVGEFKWPLTLLAALVIFLVFFFKRSAGNSVTIKTEKSPTNE